MIHTRVYLVTNKTPADGELPRLIDAGSLAVVRHHLTAERYDITVPSTKDALALAVKGVLVELAKEPDQAELPFATATAAEAAQHDPALTNGTEAPAPAPSAPRGRNRTAAAA